MRISGQHASLASGESGDPSLYFRHKKQISGRFRILADNLFKAFRADKAFTLTPLHILRLPVNLQPYCGQLRGILTDS
ncbi:hypothetical protein D3C80_2050050 [compost metagenome]